MKFNEVTMSHSTVVRDKIDGQYAQFDMFSRLLEDRIIYIDTEFHDPMASLVVSQLMVLSAKDPKAPIKMYINSPGGSVTSGLSIYDTMQMVPNVIETCALGLAASMGSFILSGGTKGHRYSLPNSRIMIHEMSSGFQGTSSDRKVRNKELDRLQDSLNDMLGRHCGKSRAQMEKACERDNTMTPEEAKKFGLIDKVLYPTDNPTAW